MAHGRTDVDIYMPIASVMFLTLSVLISGGLKAAGISFCTKDVFLRFVRQICWGDAVLCGLACLRCCQRHTAPL